MKVVLTGGPHAGKTTLIHALKDHGVPIVREGALSVIEDLMREFGTAEAVRAWRLANMTEFQMRVGERQMEFEREATGDLIIADRGTIDGLAYCQHYGVAVPDGLPVLCANSGYDLCVLCELVLPFDERPGSGRMSDETTARRMEALLFDCYQRYEVPTVRLPVLPIEERVARLFELIEQRGGKRPRFTA